MGLAVVYALTDEVRPILKEASIRTRILQKPALIQLASFRGVEVAFCRTGVGIANAHEATEHLLKHARPALILSLGYAGGAHPDLHAGDLILPTEILSETPTDRFLPAEGARSDLERLIREEGLPYRAGPLMTLWKIAGRSVKEQAEGMGAVGVDMETAAVAAVSQKAGIPFASIRAVFDPLGEEYPSDEPYDEDHPVSYLLRNPKVLLRAPRYARAAALCRKNLFRVVSRFIDSLALAEPDARFGQGRSYSPLKPHR